MASLTTYLNLSIGLNISLSTIILNPSAYPHGIIAILVSFLVVYEFEYPILYPTGNVFISATFDFKYPTFLNPQVFGIDNLPSNAEPTLTASKCISGKRKNAEELHMCSIPVSILFSFNILIHSINLSYCSLDSLPSPKNAIEKCENAPSIFMFFHAFIACTIFSLLLYIKPYLPKPVSIFKCALAFVCNFCAISSTASPASFDPTVNIILFLINISISSSSKSLELSKIAIIKSASLACFIDFSTPIFSTSSDASLIPAVSTKFNGIPLIVTNSSIVSLVVPAISVTIALSSLRIAFKSEDFPAFGFPIIAVFIPSFIIFPLSNDFSNFFNFFPTLSSI